MQGQDDSMMMMMMMMGGLVIVCMIAAGGYYYYTSSKEEPAPAPVVYTEPEPEPAYGFDYSGGTGDLSVGDATPESDRTKCKDFKYLDNKVVKGSYMYKNSVVVSKKSANETECCQYCGKTTDCNAWVYEKKGGICQLKKLTGDIKRYETTGNSGFISGVKTDSQPAPVPSPGTPNQNCPGTPVSLSYYTWQTNVPCNYGRSSTNKLLKPFYHIVIPQDLVAKFPLGKKLYIHALKNKATANETPHTGWVEVADTCIDTPCFNGNKPIVRLYIGDFVHSKASCTASANSNKTDVIFHKNTSKQWTLPINDATIACPSPDDKPSIKEYGGKALGNNPGFCGQCDKTKSVMGACHIKNALGARSRPSACST